MTTKHTDEEIVSITRSRDPESYSEIITRYQYKLLRYATRITHNPDDAQDVVQNAFIKAYKNLNKFKTNMKFSSWIYRIVHNEAINLLKKNKRIVRDSTILESIRSNEPSHLETLEVKDLTNTLNHNLSLIPTKYQEVLTLFYLEEKSYSEISDILRIPTSTVGTNLARGKKLLATLYQREEHE